MEKNPKKMLVILGIIAVVVVAIIIVAASTKKTPNNNENGGDQNPAGQAENMDAAAGEEATSTPESSTVDANAIEGVGQVVDLKDAVAVIPGGANLVTPDNKVVTSEGVVASNSAIPMSEEAPKQSGFLDKESLPEEVIKLNVGNNKFEPNSFTVKAGAPTTISLTGVDSFSHVITFESPSLSAIAILVGPNQTKAITFNAPMQPGDYVFRCDSPEHAANGETGKMIVK